MYSSKHAGRSSLNVMHTRVKLAAIDFNINENRKQNVVHRERNGSGKVGEKYWKF